LFQKNSGLKIEIQSNVKILTCLKFLFLLITHKIINLIIMETNIKADKVSSKFRFTKSKRFFMWVLINTIQNKTVHWFAFMDRADPNS